MLQVFKRGPCFEPGVWGLVEARDSVQFPPRHGLGLVVEFFGRLITGAEMQVRYRFIIPLTFSDYIILTGVSIALSFLCTENEGLFPRLRPQNLVKSACRKRFHRPGKATEVKASGGPSATSRPLKGTACETPGK